MRSSASLVTLQRGASRSLAAVNRLETALDRLSPKKMPVGPRGSSFSSSFRDGMGDGGRGGSNDGRGGRGGGGSGRGRGGAGGGGDWNNDRGNFRGGRESGRGGGPGRGRLQNSGGRSTNSNNRSSNADSAAPRERFPARVPSFSERFLDPAARGELKNHRSGIPRLAARKGKGNSVRGADPSRDDDEESPFAGFGDDDADFLMMGRGGRQGGSRPPHNAKNGTIEQGSKLEDLNPQEHQEVLDFIQMYQALEHTPDQEDYYWREAEYEDKGLAKKMQVLERLRAEATRDADGNLLVEVDDETFAMFEAAEDDKKEEGGDSGSRATPAVQQDQRQQRNDDIPFIMDTMGIKTSDEMPNPETYDVAVPLVLKGPTMSDFILSMMEHPTKFGTLRYDSPHPENTREPHPDIPPRRRNPPVDFVNAHARFLYVWGLPPVLGANGEPGDVENAVHSLEIQKTVAGLFDVSLDAVCAATTSSAFVGFPSRVDQRFALEFGPVQKLIHSPVRISKYIPQDGDRKSFDEAELDSVVLLENLPSGLTPSLLASTLFPSGTDVGDLVYGGLTPADFVVLTPHSAALRFGSAELADSAVTSSIVEERLAEFGQHRIRYNKARRELVFTGKHGGPGGTEPERELGRQLIVDGDMPKKDFYRSHAAALHLRNLDPSVTKAEISSFFQPLCAMPRDVEGSTEFVTCYEGLPTGRAYVGFDEHGEAEAAMAMCESSGRLGGLGPTVVIMKRVKDANKVHREKRQTRDVGELLDNLHNWEQYVDPKDLAELFENGISKEALDEALRAIRFHNPTFASLDQAMRSETVNPEKDTGGMYRELVQTYIATLKECISTPDNPGPIYDSLFFPDEEIDTEIFDNEPARQQELKKRREVP